MKIVSRFNSRNITRSTTVHVLLAGVVVLLALGFLSPQPVEARLEYEIQMPEGDPDDGLDNDGGGSGGSRTFLPPDSENLDGSENKETVSPTLLPQSVWLDNILIRFHFAPRYYGHVLIWTPSFFEMRMLGGGN